MSHIIMTVEDSVSARELVSLTLTQAGYKVVEATDGKDALNKMKNISTDLLITDINMPKMNGIELIRQIRAIPSCKFLPIVIVTTESQTEKKKEAKAAGATAWLTKPFQPEQLLSVINKILD